MKTIKIFTLGCKANQYDSQLIREKFLGSGYREIDNGLAADTYLINTCTVTQRADAESLSLIRKARRQNPKAKIIVTGCLTELDEEKIKAAGKVNLIVKNRDKQHLLDLYLGKLRTKELTNSRTKNSISYFAGHTRAFLKIQDGCDNFCAYCKVPFVRGKPRSKPLQEVRAEAARLVENGFKEIVLTGICLGKYGRELSPSHNIVQVITVLEKIPGLLRIRLSSLEAADISDELINKIATSHKLCPHLHIPIQSGDERILKLMQRNYTAGACLDLIRKIKTKIPAVAITTDVLVGFPSEAQENFEHTLRLIKQINPLKTHIFPYSRREGTMAAGLQDRISPQLIKARIAQLQEVALSCALKYKRQFLNQLMPVLIEGHLKENPAFWEGHTANYLRVLVQSKTELQNQLIPLKLRQIHNDSILAF